MSGATKCTKGVCNTDAVRERDEVTRVFPARHEESLVVEVVNRARSSCQDLPLLRDTNVNIASLPVYLFTVLLMPTHALLKVKVSSWAVFCNKDYLVRSRLASSQIGYGRSE
jgi:hypothetical protein